MKRTGLTTFSRAIALVNDEPPNEIRIFHAGINDSRKGPALFDDAAARDVMAAFKQHGADLMFDLEHLSLDDTAPNYDPDARAWSGLELRPAETPVDGAQYDCFGTAVRWTEDGDRRLRKKTQRYISPAFRVDTKTRRVVELVNVAITSLPATDKLTPLVAARRSALEKPMKMNAMLLALLGLAEDADEKTVADALAELMKDPVKFAGFLSAMLDADDKKDAEKPIAAKDDEEVKPTAEMKKTSRRASPLEDALALEVRSLKEKVQASDVRQLITANRQKLTPALEKWALKQSPEDLADFLAAQPNIISDEKHSEKKNSGAKLEDVKLTREDRELCKQLNRAPEAFLKHKRALAAERNAASSADEEG